MKLSKKLLLLILVAVLYTVPAYAEQVYFVTVKGVISDYSTKFINNAIQKAVADNASALVIKLDTPGGLVSSTRDIVQSILESKVPVAVFVAPQGAHAGSAGSFITLSANYALMSEGSNIGAAHPVGVTGEDIKGDMRAKAENDLESFMRSISEKRGRNVANAVAMVKESKSFTASEALKAGLIDGIVNSDEELITLLEQKLGGNIRLTRADIEPTMTEKVAFFITNPNILMLLFFIGVIAIILEVKIPGTFVFAGVGIVALILFLFGINIIPINYLALLLIFIALGLFVAELFVTSFGLLGIAGLVSFVFGIRLMFDTANTQGVSVSLGFQIFIAIATLGFFVLIVKLIIKDHFRKPVTGRSGMVGLTGEVMEWKDHKGKVFVRGEIWEAHAHRKFRKGDAVTVISSEGLVLNVKKEGAEEPHEDKESE